MSDNSSSRANRVGTKRPEPEQAAMDIPMALSYDDILLVPLRSSITSRRQVDTSTRLSRNLALQIPIVAANMDTVTESAMAIELARQGGVGIVHRFLPIEEEAAEVRKVKRAESFVITQPYTVSPEVTVEFARNIMDQRDVGGLVVMNEQEQLVGLISARDVRFVRTPDLLVQDVMTPRQDLIPAPADISLEEAQDVFNKHKIEKLP